SEGALTEWKKALIWRLYHHALVLIEKGFEHYDTVSRKLIIDTVVHSLSEYFPRNIIREHLSLLPEQYIRVTHRRFIRTHIRGIDHMKRHGTWISFQRGRNVTFLTVIAPDHPKALSDICGTITSSDINIVGARIFTRNDGIIIDTFLVVDGAGNAFIPPETKRTFKKNFLKVISGEVDVKELILSYIRRWKRRKTKIVFAPPRIRVHNDISSRFTVIDVFATDYTGLLYDISSVLSSFNIDIHTARIGTDNDQVADAFYLQKSDGGKIEDEETLSRLTESMIERLNEAYGQKLEK
ncbi:MAG TPA: ACT domain-containing protein, partial [Anaerolineae bacterium]|nr:ACT domain-containing protein [Anaerolineae bacterium]